MCFEGTLSTVSSEIIKEYLGISLTNAKPCISVIENDSIEKTYKIRAEAFLHTEKLHKECSKQIILCKAIMYLLSSIPLSCLKNSDSVLSRSHILFDIFVKKVGLINTITHQDASSDIRHRRTFLFALNHHLEHHLIPKLPEVKRKNSASKTIPLIANPSSNPTHSEKDFPRSLKHSSMAAETIKDYLGVDLDEQSPFICFKKIPQKQNDEYFISPNPPPEDSIDKWDEQIKLIKTTIDFLNSPDEPPGDIDPSILKQVRILISIFEKKRIALFSWTMPTKRSESSSSVDQDRRCLALALNIHLEHHLNKQKPKHTPRKLSVERKHSSISLNTNLHHTSSHNLFSHSPRHTHTEISSASSFSTSDPFSEFSEPVITQPKWSYEALNYLFFRWQYKYGRQDPLDRMYMLKKDLKKSGEYKSLKKQKTFEKTYLSTIVTQKLCYAIKPELDYLEEKKEEFFFSLNPLPKHSISSSYEEGEEEDVFLLEEIFRESPQKIEAKIPCPTTTTTIIKTPSFDNFTSSLGYPSSQRIEPKEKTKGPKQKENPNALALDIARQISYIYVIENSEKESTIKDGLKVLKEHFNDPKTFTLCCQYFENIILKFLHHFTEKQDTFNAKILRYWKEAVDKETEEQEDFSNNIFGSVCEHFLKKVLNDFTNQISDTYSEKFYCLMKSMTQQTYTTPFIAIKEAILSCNNNKINLYQKTELGSRSLSYRLEEDRAISLSVCETIVIEKKQKEEPPLHLCEIKVTNKMYSNFSHLPSWGIKLVLEGKTASDLIEHDLHFIDKNIIFPLKRAGFNVRKS